MIEGRDCSQKGMGESSCSIAHHSDFGLVRLSVPGFRTTSVPSVFRTYGLFEPACPMIEPTCPSLCQNSLVYIARIAVALCAGFLIQGHEFNIVQERSKFFDSHGADHIRPSAGSITGVRRIIFLDRARTSAAMRFELFRHSLVERPVGKFNR